MSQVPYQLLSSKDEALAEEGYRISSHEDRRAKAWRLVSLIVVAGAAALGFLCGSHYQARSARDVPVQKSFLDKCPSNLPLLASPPADVNPWAPLSAAEIQDIRTWLFDSRQKLNLTDGRTAKDSDNVVFQIEVYPPSKDDVLAFLDAKGVEAKAPPGRYARVTIDHGGLGVPVTRDYVVGPLPTSEGTSIRHLKEIYHREDIPFNARGLMDVTSLLETLGKAMAPMADAVKVCPFIFSEAQEY